MYVAIAHCFKLLSFLHLSDIKIAKIETDIIGLVRCEYNDIAITHC